MTEHVTVTGTVRRVKRLRNTRDGNPRYNLVIDVDGDYSVMGITQADSSYILGIDWDSLEGKRVRVEHKQPRTVVYFTRLVVL